MTVEDHGVTLKSVHVQDDSQDWGTIRDAAFLLHREPREIHDLCQQDHISHRVEADGTWRIHIPSVIEFLSRALRFGQHPKDDSSASYAVVLAALHRIEGTLQTIIEGNARMTQADNQIEADVSALRTAFASLGTLISTLNTTVATLQGEVANNGSPSATTLSDLDDITSQITGLVPATATPSDPGTPSDPAVPPSDPAPASDPTSAADPTTGTASADGAGTVGTDLSDVPTGVAAPVDTTVPDPTSDPFVSNPDASGTSAGVAAEEPEGGSSSSVAVDPSLSVGETPAPDATPQVVDAPTHQSP